MVRHSVFRATLSHASQFRSTARQAISRVAALPWCSKPGGPETFTAPSAFGCRAFSARLSVGDPLRCPAIERATRSDSPASKLPDCLFCATPSEFDIELPVQQQRIFNLRSNLVRRNALNQIPSGPLPRLIAGLRFELREHITLGVAARSERLAGLVSDGAGQFHDFSGASFCGRALI